jgi:4-hydroxy-tetrahydrodipicolinate synthase
MRKFTGAFTALVTPMKDNGAVDYDGWRRLIGFQLESGIDGLVPLGTTGETPTLEEDEEENLIRIIIDAAGGAVPVIVGAGSNDTKHMIRYVTRAKELGADAALVVTPYYNRPNDEGLLRHFQAASSVGIPVIIYNIASRTGRNIPAPLMARLAQLPNIAGVKESSGDMGQITDIIGSIKIPAREAGGDFAVLSGDDGFTVPLVALGGDGLVSVISNAAPAKVTAMVRAALAGDFETARRRHYELLPLMKAAFLETNPVPIKAALAMMGLPAGPARLPLGPLSPANEAPLRAALDTVLRATSPA